MSQLINDMNKELGAISKTVSFVRNNLYRLQKPYCSVGMGGSGSKPSTKEMLSKIVESSVLRCDQNPGNIAAIKEMVEVAILRNIDESSIYAAIKEVRKNQEFMSACFKASIQKD